MAASKAPTIADLVAWLEVEKDACRFNFRNLNASGQNEQAGFFARRMDYLEVATEVIDWHRVDSASDTK